MTLREEREILSYAVNRNLLLLIIRLARRKLSMLIRNCAMLLILLVAKKTRLTCGGVTFIRPSGCGGGPARGSRPFIRLTLRTSLTRRLDGRLNCIVLLFLTFCLVVASWVMGMFVLIS